MHISFISYIDGIENISNAKNLSELYLESGIITRGNVSALKQLKNLKLLITVPSLDPDIKSELQKALPECSMN